jgi:crossover junction endodeoxyribonuclease RuvC
VCARAGLDVAEFPPARVKRTVAGAGRADKAQIAQMVRALLGLAEVPPADAADALAIAITCLQQTVLDRLGAPHENQRLSEILRSARRPIHRRRRSPV